MIKCIRGCGATDLHWKVINGNYKLFGNDDLIHICNDGASAPKKRREQVTATILSDLNLKAASDIPDAEEYIPKKKKTLKTDPNYG